MFDWLIHSKTRLRMLKLFFRDVSRPLYGLEISQKLKASPGTTHRELTAMLAKKVLVKKREGALILYQLNTTHPHFLELQSTVKPVSKGDKVVFVSDIHFEDRFVAEKAEAFLRLLNYARQEAAELVLVGDIFETLKGDWFRMYLCHKPVLDELFALATQMKVTHVIGNHDALLEAFLGEDGEGHLFQSKVRLTREYRNSRLGMIARHGQEVNDIAARQAKTGQSNGADLLKALGTTWSTAWQMYYQRLSGVAREADAQAKYAESIRDMKGWQKETMKGLSALGQRLMTESDSKVVVFGHVHQETEKKIKRGTVFTLGSWTGEAKHWTFLEIGKKGGGFKRVMEV